MTGAPTKKSDDFLSLGLRENWSFERVISEINLKASIDIHDDTLSFSFLNENLQWFSEASFIPRVKIELLHKVKSGIFKS